MAPPPANSPTGWMEVPAAWLATSGRAAALPYRHHAVCSHSRAGNVCRRPAPVLCADADLAASHGKALLPGFGDEEDQDEQIASTVAEVSSLFKECEQRLRQMDSAAVAGDDDKARANASPWPRVCARVPCARVPLRANRKAVQIGLPR